ncbi:hypothetical protein [Streptomyces sp. NPDC002676]
MTRTTARVRPVRARNLLEKLCTLFLLDQLAGHTGDLLAEEHLSADQERGLRVLNDPLGPAQPHLDPVRLRVHSLPHAYSVSPA